MQPQKIICLLLVALPDFYRITLRAKFDIFNDNNNKHAATAEAHGNGSHAHMNQKIT